MSPERILVTGASGFVGRALCGELLQRGYSVRAVVRYGSKPIELDCETAKVAGISADTDWRDTFCSVHTVIHLAARVHVMHEEASNPLEEFRKVNLAGTMHLARVAVASGVRRLIYVSSIKVNGEVTNVDRQFVETDIPSSQDPYGISKWEAEQALHKVARETGLEIVIVRPPLVYGPKVKGNFIQMLLVLAKGVPLPLASIRNLRSLIYVGNLVDALITCASHPSAAGQTYLLSDGEDISTPDLLRRLGGAIGRSAWLLNCPLFLLQFAGRLVRKSDQVDRLLGSLRLDNGKIRRELNWTPPYTLQQGLQATADWYRNTRS
ncbi:MAG: SDR family oxidoreductase [Gallionellaceae bacterium]|nr:SDR family oxidoreductase [Gallionellaceae bacterium]